MNNSEEFQLTDNYILLMKRLKTYNVPADPTVSLRELEHDIPVSREQVKRILKKHGYKS